MNQFKVFPENYPSTMDCHRNPPFCDKGDNSSISKPEPDITNCDNFLSIDIFNL